MSIVLEIPCTINVYNHTDNKMYYIHAVRLQLTLYIATTPKKL